jgi:hypothetical protein
MDARSPDLRSVGQLIDRQDRQTLPNPHELSAFSGKLDKSLIPNYLRTSLAVSQRLPFRKKRSEGRPYRPEECETASGGGDVLW